MWYMQPVKRLRPACAYAQSDQSLCYSPEYFMSVMLLTEQHLEFLSLKGGCTGLSESTLVKMPHCWRSHVVAHFVTITLASSQDLDEPVHKCRLARAFDSLIHKV